MSDEGIRLKVPHLRKINKSSTISHPSSRDVSRDLTPVERSPISKPRRKTTIITNPNSKVDNLKVICRIRPLSKKEQDLNDPTCLELVDEKTVSFKSSNLNSTPHKLAFDRVFSAEADQQEVYEVVSKPIIESAFEGFNGTIMTYGQSSSGKSYIMFGTPNDNGLVPRMATHIFQKAQESGESISVAVKFSAIELYSEKIKDLMKPEKNNMKIRQDKTKGICIEDMSEHMATKEEELMNLIKTALFNKLPNSPSKAHLILMITITQTNTIEQNEKSSRIYLADLADSEKVSKSGPLSNEARLLNKSLNSLGNVIKLLSEQRFNQHIPYRESNLTRILQDSLGGNSKTTVVITCSPSRLDSQETLLALKFGYRAKLINNAARMNVESTVPNLQRLLSKYERANEDKNRKIQALQTLLKDNGVNITLSIRDDSSPLTGNKSDIFKDGNSLMDENPELELPQDDEFLNKTLSNFSEIPDNDEEKEKMKELESKIEDQNFQIEQLNDENRALLQEYKELQKIISDTELDNRSIARKVNLSNLKVDGFQTRLKQRDEQIEELEKLNKMLLEENKKFQIKNHYYEEIFKTEAENKEKLTDLSVQAETLDFDREVNVEGSLTNSDNKNSSAEKEESDKSEEYIISRFVQTISLKYGIKGPDQINDLSALLMNKLKVLVDIKQEESSKKETKLICENTFLKQELEFSQKELNIQKENYEILLKDFEKLLEEYEQAASGNFPNFETIIQTMIKGTVTKIESSFKKERLALMKEIEDRVHRITNVESKLEEEAEKQKHLRNTVNEAQKKFHQKFAGLAQQTQSLKKSPKAIEHENKENDHALLKKNSQIVRDKIIGDFSSLTNSLRLTASSNKENENMINTQEPNVLRNLNKEGLMDSNFPDEVKSKTLSMSAKIHQNTKDNNKLRKASQIERKLDFADA